MIILQSHHVLQLLYVLMHLAWGLIAEMRCIIHYGVPSDKEAYVQQIGREGLDSYAMLHSKKLLENCEPNVLEYVRNKSQCRCDMLFHEFENCDHSAENQGCKCCDICISVMQCALHHCH